MSKTTMVKVDGAALKAEILKKWPTLTDASNEIGCAGSYLSNIVRRGEIPHTKVKVIEGTLGVPAEKYVQAEKEPETYKVYGNRTNLIDADRLKQSIIETSGQITLFDDIYEIIDQAPRMRAETIFMDQEINEVIVRGEEYTKVVRCKDCNLSVSCWIYEQTNDDFGFCHYGVKDYE